MPVVVPANLAGLIGDTTLPVDVACKMENMQPVQYSISLAKHLKTQRTSNVAGTMESPTRIGIIASNAARSGQKGGQLISAPRYDDEDSTVTARALETTSRLLAAVEGLDTESTACPQPLPVTAPGHIES